MTVPLNQVQGKDIRIRTLLPVIDNFLGGGFAPGESIFLAGQPGAGKSTFLLQLLKRMADLNYKSLYISGEEALSQIKVRADRTDSLKENIVLSDSTELTSIYKAVKETDPKFIVIDSAQMLYKKDGKQGSEKEIKDTMLGLREHFKTTDKVLIFIGQTTKGNSVAGAMKMQFMVDAIFYLRVSGDKRLMYALKNRHGSIDTTLPLTMTKDGFVEFSGKTQHRRFPKLSPLQWIFFISLALLIISCL